MQDALKAIGWGFGFRVQGFRGLHRDNGKNGSYHSMLGLYWDNGEENGNYYSILGLNWDNGKENGNYCIIFLGLRRPLRPCVSSNLKGLKGLGLFV